MVKCLECGREFKTNNSLSKHIGTHMTQEQYFDKYLRTSEQEGKCVVCGKPTRFRNFSYSNCCSQSCRNTWINQNRTEEERQNLNNKISKSRSSEECKNKIKQTCLEKYGTEHPGQNELVKEKRKKTCLDKYGTEYTFQNEEIKSKIKQSIYNHYGDEGLKSKEIREKTIKTCQERYGTNNGGASSQAQEKIRKTTLEHYGVECSWQAKEVIDKIKNNRNKDIEKFCKENNCISIQDIYSIYGTGWYQMNIVNLIEYKGLKYIKQSDINKIKDYYNKMLNFHTSIQQENLTNYIKSFYNGIIEINKKSYIFPYELDIVLPDLALAIEYNGIYWHSIEHGIDKDYHLNKSLLCREKGIRLIHIYEFEDIQKQYNLLKEFILGKDNYPKNDFNKNNFGDIPISEIIYNNKYTIYGAGKLYK